MNSIWKECRERRLWERYPASGTPASLAWNRGATEEIIRGHLLDIGGGGAAFASECPPPAGIPLQLRLRSRVPQGVRLGPVAARLVMTMEALSGQKIAHLQFVAPLPTGLLEMVRAGAE